VNIKFYIGGILLFCFILLIFFAIYQNFSNILEKPINITKSITELKGFLPQYYSKIILRLQSLEIDKINDSTIKYDFTRTDKCVLMVTFKVAKNDGIILYSNLADNGIGVLTSTKKERIDESIIVYKIADTDTSFFSYFKNFNNRYKNVRKVLEYSFKTKEGYTINILFDLKRLFKLKTSNSKNEQKEIKTERGQGQQSRYPELRK